MIVLLTVMIVAALLAILSVVSVERHFAYLWALDNWKRSTAWTAVLNDDRARLMSLAEEARTQRDNARDDANAAVQADMAKLRSEIGRLHAIIGTLDEQVSELGHIPRRDIADDFADDDFATPCTGPSL